MLSRSARAGQRAVRASVPRTARGFATAAPAAGFEKLNVTGVSVVAKDGQGPSTKLAVVAKAGTRYQPAPGLAVGLEAFAFKNTAKRSALRLTRETELLGGRLTAYHTRETVVLEATFLRENLPYFTELLGEVVAETKFDAHELDEEILPVLHLQQTAYAANPAAMASDAVHAVAFHTGLGAALTPSPATPIGHYLSSTAVAQLAQSAYARPNFAVVADNATQTALAKWVEPFFKATPTKAATDLAAPASTYYGGQQRLESTAGNAVVVAFPTAGLVAPDANADVLAALLGGASNIKWTPGFTLLAQAAAATPGATLAATNTAYSDAGLLTISVTAPSAAGVRTATAAAVAALKTVASGSVGKEAVAKAIAKAKVDALLAHESSSTAIAAAGTAALHGAGLFQPASVLKALDAVTAQSVQALAKKLLAGKASFAAVGDLHVLPFAEDVGLTV